MAKVYRVPDDRPPPAFEDYFGKGKSGCWDAYEKAQQDYLKSLQEWARLRYGPSPYIGEIVRFGVGDGNAVYMILRLKPCEIMHIPIGDAWQIPAAHARGLKASDLRGMVERDRKLTELFPGNKGKL
jgi:hypothetical protein